MTALAADLGRIVGAANVEVRPPPGPIRVGGRPARLGLQDSCQLCDGVGDCCGAAGTCAILRPRDSRRMLAPKLAALAELDLDFLVVVNPGCQRQLSSAARRVGLRTRVVHFAELVVAARDGRR
ncbi:(Fe-S)-binding protein [Dactylosporangium salmoneum]|uniref:Cysteine-rich domain-containing protein n=1 Tax=Dactylosporangium salmoneum TaxID=53361 RepID=A0ABN3FJA4_9ACTN